MIFQYLIVIIIGLATSFMTNFAEAQVRCQALILDAHQASQVETKVSERRRTEVGNFDAKTPAFSKYIVFDGLPNLNSAINKFAQRSGIKIYKNADGFGFIVQSFQVKTPSGYRQVMYEVPIEDFSFTRSSHLPSDYVINAGLETGRRVLNKLITSTIENSKKTAETDGVFIFVDVNNLGWINKHFNGQKKVGDLYIEGVAKVLTQIAGDNGLVFRQGGDEFALIIPAVSPERLQSLTREISFEVKRQVHSIFLAETRLRAEKVREAKRKLDIGEISKEYYESLLDEFKKYASYSQEGVSIGAEYLSANQTPQKVQSTAEQRALQMKLAIKQAHHQDVSKYTGEKSEYSGAPRLSFKYEVPIISPVEKISDRIVSVIEPPVAQEMRYKEIRTLKIIGTERVSVLVDESGKKSVFKLTENSDRVEPLEINANTGFLDLRDQKNKKIIENLARQEPVNHFVLVNLLNLGKLNYFKSGTQTGDTALALLAKKINNLLRDSDMAFKGFGSEFVLYINSKNLSHTEVLGIKNRIEAALQNDSSILKIYQEQVDVLERELSTTVDEVKKTQILNAISEVRSLMAMPVVQVKTAEISKASHSDLQNILDVMR